MPKRLLAFLEGRISKAEANRRANQNWWFWRPILEEGGVTININELHVDEIHEYNEAINIYDKNKAEIMKKHQKK